VSGSDGSQPTRIGTEAPFVAVARWSPDGKLIAYSADLLGPPDVFLVDAAGGEPRRMTTGFTQAYFESWRPGTAEFLYADNKSGDFELYSLSMTAEQPTQITSIPGNESGDWSPDGTQFASTRSNQGRSTVWVTRPGEEPRQLTTEGYETFSDWSPDGSLIAYTTTVTGRADVWVVPATGGEARQLTNDFRADWGPRFSPDGKWLSYVSQRGGQQDIWIVPVDSGESIRVTDDPGEEGIPQWSRDGTALTFTYNDQHSHIWAIPVDGGAPRQLTNGTKDEHTALVSPDGSQVLYVSQTGGNADLFVVPIAGGTPTPLTTESTDENRASWSPDGTKILFHSRRAGTTSIFVMPATGGAATKLLAWTEHQGDAIWSPDGSQIAFTSARESENSDVWVMGADGSSPRRLTTNADVGAVGLNLGAITWSRDGRTLAMAQRAAGGEGAGIATVTMPANGGPLTRIPFDGALAPLEWSKSGDLAMLGFGRGSPTRFDAFVYRGGRPERLLAQPTDDICVKWSPDGSMIACRAERDGQTELVIVPAAGGEPRFLTNSFANEQDFDWTPDGKTIVFTASEARNQLVTVKVTSILNAAMQ
jgi:Tol biopolymer transport system component